MGYMCKHCGKEVSLAEAQRMGGQIHKSCVKAYVRVKPNDRTDHSQPYAPRVRRHIAEA